jgi:hypothetical protein
MDILKIKSQIKSPYFNVILQISQSSKNDLKSDFVKSSIKSLNTLRVWKDEEGSRLGSMSTIRKCLMKQPIDFTQGEAG